ncbi:MAG TPA: L,D-transpeptidase [Solirubrobacteraceae bacterium]|nr:L,D-transpeptidase [Solirubrobacteraceae bacterium]
MKRRDVRVAALAVVLLAAALGVLLLTRGERTPDRPSEPASPALVRPVPHPRMPAQRPRPPRGPLGARVLRRVQLRERPGGPVVRAVGTLTGYNSPRVLAVVARRGRWIGVLSDHVANSRAAWIPADAVELLHEPYRLDVDLSARRLTVRREGRVVRRVRVAVGKPGTATPTGRFAVTDALRIDDAHPQYGCCALALTGRQPDVPQGWTGGDRLAIHGTGATGSIGTPASNGCLRATDADMRWLLRHVTLGAQVRIRR